MRFILYVLRGRFISFMVVVKIITILAMLTFYYFGFSGIARFIFCAYTTLFVVGIAFQFKQFKRYKNFKRND